MKEKLYVVALTVHDAENHMRLNNLQRTDCEILTRAEHVRGRSLNRHRVIITEGAARRMDHDMRDAIAAAQDAYLMNAATISRMAEDAARPLTMPQPQSVRGASALEKDYTLTVSDPKGFVIFERRLSADQLRELPV